MVEGTEVERGADRRSQKGWNHTGFGRFPGSTRSVDAAARLGAHVSATKGSKKQHSKPKRAPGSWNDDASKWRWLERAEARDLHVLHEAGDRVQAAMVDYMQRLQFIGIRTLMDCKALTTWREALRLFETLAKYVPQSVTGVSNEHTEQAHDR